MTVEQAVYDDFINPERLVIAGASESIKDLSNQQLATLNLAIDAGWACQIYDGYDVVSHLFDEKGQLRHSLLKDAFVIEVNRRIDRGDWE